jgi:hypothetical protein
MIQFNLLPDIKLEYIKARRTKRLLIAVASLVATASLAMVIILFVFVGLLQKKHMTDLRNDINSNVKKLQGTQDLDKILTIQNQLSSLGALHDQKPTTSRLFGYLAQVTPSNVTISKVNVDFPNNTIVVSGEAKSLLDVNRFVDTLKFTNYTSDKDANATPLAFSKVLLTTFGTGEKGSSYTITFMFTKDTIFDGKQQIKLTVPQTVTTRSTTEKPGVLFKQQTEPVIPEGQ